jgi:hypothetical protein
MERKEIFRLILWIDQGEQRESQTFYKNEEVKMSKRKTGFFGTHRVLSALFPSHSHKKQS